MTDSHVARTDTYRSDLDGLRGLAITLVVVFHVWFDRVSGGVDVFLTLSGYFFVASLYKHVVAVNGPDTSWMSAINPLTRLWRLMRRLLPALLVVLAAIVALTLLVLPRARWESLSGEVIASALYYQNWHLAFASQDYAAADSANSPMQHLWSMSVQGQFFVGTLVALLLVGGLLKILGISVAALRKPAVIRGALGSVLGAAALTSFAWAVHRHGIDQPFNYYDTLARSWEPLVGGLLALWMPRLAMTQWLRSALSVAALVLIVSSGWWIAGVEEFPSTMALVPVGATLLLIWVGSARTAPAGIGRSTASTWLAHPWAVWLGSIAYALYLWHWPLLIFYLAWRYQRDVTFVEGAAIIAVSVVLAYLTTRFVEIPLRSRRSSDHRRRRFVPTYAATMTCLLLAASVTAGWVVHDWRSHGQRIMVDATALDPELYPGARAFWSDAPVLLVEPQPDPLAVKDDWPISSQQGFVSGFDDPLVRVGVYGAPGAPRTVALVGGSHSEHWLTALDEIGRERGFAVNTYLKAGCPLITTTILAPIGSAYPECNVWSREVMDRLAIDRPDAVFTTSTRPTDGDGSGDYIPNDYLEIFAEFRDRGQQVIAVRDTPWVLGPTLTPPECLAEGRSAADCGVDREHALSSLDPTSAIAGDFPNMTFLDFTDAMCDDTTCPAIVGNVLVWHDFHHLTTSFVRTLVPALDESLRDALTQWW
ncbi:acyltransferase family protein [Williamsia limnetica]|uniref:acyltransferase family protein n=1 Tax=Williamsia limnetica TaxID=882452 RepID=UPI001FE2662B|nr:acyltransferase family protein [Williamsia limnetica]